MKGVPELLVLRVLSDEEMYGYQIVRALDDAAGSAISLGESVVYPVLHALERRGSLASRSVTVQGRRRIYYRMTRRGRRELRGTISEWTRITEAVSRLLQEPAHG